MGGCCVGDCYVGDNSGPMGNQDKFIHAINRYQKNSGNAILASDKIEAEVYQIREQYRKKAVSQERGVVSEIAKLMDKFTSDLEAINSVKAFGHAMNIDIKPIHEKRKKISKEAAGFITARLDDRMAIMDPELSVILREADDKKRKAQVKQFCEKIIKDSKAELKSQLLKNVENQQMSIREAAKKRFAELEKHAKSENQLPNIQALLQENERLRLQYMYEHDIYSMFSDEICLFDDIRVPVAKKKIEQAKVVEKSMDNKRIEKLLMDLIECNKAVFKELNTIKQAQRDMHRKLQEISLKVEAINPEELSEISKQVKKLQLMAEGVEESARLIMLTSVMNELDEVVGNK